MVARKDLQYESAHFPAQIGVIDIQVINPDTFLQTATGRVWTPENSKAAWPSSFAALESALASHAKNPPQILVICGVHGAGKSHWIGTHVHEYAPCICFDAALPGARHRKPIIDIARQRNAVVRTIWRIKDDWLVPAFTKDNRHMQAPQTRVGGRQARRNEDHSPADVTHDEVQFLGFRIQQIPAMNVLKRPASPQPVEIEAHA